MTICCSCCLSALSESADKQTPVFDAARGELTELDATFEGMFAFLAELYDAEHGGFHRTIAERQATGARPRLEATGLAMQIIERGGLLPSLPDSMRRDIVRFVQTLQDAQTGFFEDPAEAAMPLHKRRGRAVRCAVGILRLLDAKPLVPLPGVNSEHSREWNYLLDREAFTGWAADAKRVRGSSVGSVVNAQNEIMNSLPEPQRTAAIGMMHAWLSSEQDPATGLWWPDSRGAYGLISNTYKALTFHKYFDKPIPNAAGIYRAILACMREQEAPQAIFVRNALSMFRIIEPHRAAISDDERIEMIRVSARNLKPFRTTDGGYANLLGEKYGSVYGCDQAWIARDAMRHLAGLPQAPLPGGDAFCKRLAQPRRPIRGSTAMKHLFIDDHHIKRLDGARVRYHQPVKEKHPVLVPDRPWEGDNLNWILGGPVWCPDLRRWRMWYVGGQTSDTLVPLVAESADGLTWVKPALGLVEWQGSKENNLIRLGMDIERGKDKRMVLIRDDRDPDPARRYKGLNRVGGRMVPMVSADGLDWHRLDSPGFRSGDEYRLCYDPLRNRFVATGKVLIDRQDMVHERAVTLSLSDDFADWIEPATIFRSDAKDRELGAERIDDCLADPDRRHPAFVNPGEYFTDVYHMQVFVYEDLYLGLASMFHRSGFWPDRKNQDGIILPVLASSRDLRTWNRLSHAVFIPHSPRSAVEVCDQASITVPPPVRHGDALWFYYRGGRYSHMGMDRVSKVSQTGELKSAIHLARLRLDGFASVSAGEAGGTLATTPVTITGSSLRVNVDAARGELRAELLDAESGSPITGFAMDDAAPTHGNGVSIPLQWRRHETLESLRDRTVRIRFHLRNADLYAFWFEEPAVPRRNPNGRGSACRELLGAGRRPSSEDPLIDRTDGGQSRLATVSRQRTPLRGFSETSRASWARRPDFSGMRERSTITATTTVDDWEFLSS